MIGTSTQQPGSSFKNSFPFFEANPELTFLDSAASSLKPGAVAEAMTDYYNRYGVNIHRGVYRASLEATEAYERSREAVRDFIGASSEAHIIFTRGATEGLNLLAYSLARIEKELSDLKAAWQSKAGPGDLILLSDSEHHANIIPWQLFCEQTGAELLYLPVQADTGLLDWSAIDQEQIDNIKIISLALASNVTGAVHDLTRAKAIKDQTGCLLILDAAQAVCHGKLPIQELEPDFLVFSGHKMLGPNGIGILYSAPGLLEVMPPFHGGGDMILNVERDKSSYNHPPHKFEAGTPPIAEALGLEQAIRVLEQFDWAEVKAYEENLTEYGLKALSDIDGLRLFGPTENRNPIFSFELDGIHPHDIGSLLDEDNVAIRTGHHCCQLLMKAWQVPATSRASLYLYNTTADIDQLTESLKKVISIFRR